MTRLGDVRTTLSLILVRGSIKIIIPLKVEHSEQIPASKVYESGPSKRFSKESVVKGFQLQYEAMKL